LDFLRNHQRYLISEMANTIQTLVQQNEINKKMYKENIH